LSFARHFSIGLRSGEYGGKYSTRAPRAARACAIPVTLCTAKLSMTTIAPGCNIGVSGGGTVLLTEATEIGTQRMVGEVLFPQPRDEEMDLESRMGIDPLQDIDEVDVGVNSL
jgi:hypothetical protein